ncbi:MAG: hypothetical protein HEP71_23755 [Roseivirga sp.]|nr:hypothetical protein [Roseivirga sp.]
MNLRFTLLSLVLLWVVTACELGVDQPEVEPLEGREPEVVTWVSGHQWFPTTIAILVQQDETPGSIYLEANSSSNKGYMRSLRLDIAGGEFDWPPGDTLNLLNTQLPTRVSVEYEQFRDRQNQYSSKWQGDENQLGGIRVTSWELEDGLVYAAGNFFMSPYLFIDRPDIQEIEGLFNNVRVFTHADSMQAYFDQVNAFEAAKGN